MSRLLARAATRYPEAPAWIEGERVISFREAQARTDALARQFVALGGKPGDRVGLLAHNCCEGLETVFAAWKAGMVIVPVNVRLTAEEAGFIFQDSGAKFLVYTSDNQEKVEKLRSWADTLDQTVCIGDGGARALSFEEIVCSGARRPDVANTPSDLAWIFFTSGTTGKPKGAMLSHRNLLAMTSQIQLEMNQAAPRDVVLHAAPITHGSGLCAFNNIAVGAANAFIPDMVSFDVERVFAHIERYRVTTMFLVPTMVRMMSTSPLLGQFDLSSLHTIIYGGAPMPPSHLEEAIACFGPIFVQLYGQAEAPMACTVLPKSEHKPTNDGRARLLSAGREILGVHVAVLDEDDKELPYGEFGEICVRGDLVMQGYWNRPDATAETLRSGWLHTGDAGHIDEAGYLYITDRIKDTIISGGANIYPREVEDVLCRHPAVQEAAVIGVPDEKWGETARAFLVLKRGEQLSEEDIVLHCKAHMADYKRPRQIEFVDELPKSGNGKILRRELRERYWSGRTRRV